MIIVRDRDTRGHTDTGWLDSRRTFSFGNCRDPEHHRAEILLFDFR